MDKPLLTEKIRQTALTGMRGYLLCYIAMVCSGVSVGYFPVQKYCLYPPDIIAIICLSLSVYLSREATFRWKSSVHFFAWGMLFYAWGLYISPNQELYTEPVINRLLLLTLHLFSVSYVLYDKRQLVRFAALLQIVALVSLLACVLQATNSPLLPLTLRNDMQYSQEEIDFIIARPVGLCSNSNDLARLFIIIILTSCWLRHRLAWIPRIAAMIGIFLTASRFGLVLVSLNAILVVLYMIKHKGIVMLPRFSTNKGLAVAGACLIGLLALVSTQQIQVNDTLSAMWTNRLERFEVISNDIHTESEYSRARLLEKGLARVEAGPWYGTGIFSFQNSFGDMPVGVHNIYVAIIGESGWLVWGLFCITIYLGLKRVMRGDIPPADRFILQLLWVTWLATGFVSHTMLDDRGVFVIWGTLYTIPVLLSTKDGLCA